LSRGERLTGGSRRTFTPSAEAISGQKGTHTLGRSIVGKPASYAFGRGIVGKLAPHALDRGNAVLAAWLLILPGGRGRSPGWRSTLSAIGCAAVVESEDWVVSGKPLAKKLPLAHIHRKYQAKIPCANDRHCLLTFDWTVIARGKGMLNSTPHSRQLRTGRYSSHHQLYLLTTIVHCRSPLFADWRLGRLVVDQFRLAEAEGAAHSLAWVVMPDHFHWLIELRDSSLSALMRRAKSRSAHSINHALGRQCQVWQKGFHDRALRSEEDIKGVARYVVANPLRAGLVKRIGDYPLWDAIWLP